MLTFVSIDNNVYIRAVADVINFVSKPMEGYVISIFEAYIKSIYTKLSTIFVHLCMSIAREQG
jgi:hypothetical protein